MINGDLLGEVLLAGAHVVASMEPLIVINGDFSYGHG